MEEGNHLSSVGWSVGQHQKVLFSKVSAKEEGRTGTAASMPGLIGVSEFLEETREDYNSPTTSTFVSRMVQCRQTIAALEEVSFEESFRLSIDLTIGKIV